MRFLFVIAFLIVTSVPDLDARTRIRSHAVGHTSRPAGRVGGSHGSRIKHGPAAGRAPQSRGKQSQMRQPSQANGENKKGSAARRRFHKKDVR